MLHDFLDATSLLAEALESFSTHCAEGIEPAREKIAENLAKNLMLVTALNPHIGYEMSAKIALKAHREGLTLRDSALALGVGEKDFDAWVNPEAMTRPLAE
jgi:fumarate hydratase class II